MWGQIRNYLSKELFYEGPYSEPHYLESHEENLLLYVVLDAIDSAKNNQDARESDEDMYWLFDEPLDEYKSFGWYCELLKWRKPELQKYLKKHWHRDNLFFNKHLSRIAMGQIPSYVPRTYAIEMPSRFAICDWSGKEDA